MHRSVLNCIVKNHLVVDVYVVFFFRTVGPRLRACQIHRANHQRQIAIHIRSSVLVMGRMSVWNVAL